MSSSSTPSARNLSQQDRLLSVATTLGDTSLVLESFTGTEGISMPFEFQLRMLSSDPELDVKKLLKNTATVKLTLADGSTRPFHGVFSRIRQGETTTEDYFVYEGTLVPSLWLLSLKEDCRIFQAKGVPAIVAQILHEASIAFRMPSNWPSQRTPPVRDYCVQYRETSLNFISRLLEEEGIFYYFEHTDTGHTMVFSDKSEALAACPHQATVAFSYSEHGWRDDDDGVQSLARTQQLHTSKVALQDYNFETPHTDLITSAPGDTTLSSSASGEVYDYPGGYTQTGDGNAYARIRIEELEGRAFVIEGQSRCRGFQPGFRFTLEKHFRRDTNQDYILLAVTHDARDTTYRTVSGGGASYSNQYQAIPKSVAYRPSRVSVKPYIRGVQTALVVGKSGEEIWVDQYGRVRVQFPWDREGTNDEKSSCWVRVAQIWAGKNWGWMTIPRIGQEVIVDFVEGDPDHPIITGRVYNADMMPPYALPDNQTQSGIRTRSSLRGSASAYNELRFEDKTGSEMITVHAQKDMECTVENDDQQTIKNNRKIDVTGTHTEKVTGDTSITIEQGNHSLTVQQGNQTTKLDQGNQTIQLTLGDQSTKADGGSITLEAMQTITLKVGGSSITINQMGVTVKGPMISVEAEAVNSVKGALLVLQGDLTTIN